MSDPEVDSGKWTIHQVPVLAMKSEVIDDNLRIVRGDATLLLKVFIFYLYRKKSFTITFHYNIRLVSMTML